MVIGSSSERLRAIRANERFSSDTLNKTLGTKLGFVVMHVYYFHHRINGRRGIGSQLVVSSGFGALHYRRDKIAMTDDFLDGSTAAYAMRNECCLWTVETKSRGVIGQDVIQDLVADTHPNQ